MRLRPRMCNKDMLETDPLSTRSRVPAAEQGVDMEEGGSFPERPAPLQSQPCSGRLAAPFVSHPRLNASAKREEDFVSHFRYTVHSTMFTMFTM